MKMTYPTKKLEEILVGVIFVVFAMFLFGKEEYLLGVALVLALLPLLKLDFLTELVFSLKDGLKTKFEPPNTEAKIILEPTRELTSEGKTALVSYKIASYLPGTVAFDFFKDWKVWFWIVSHDSKKYKAYVRIKFIADGLEREVANGYYGGMQAWKLDAFVGIQAPGLDIPEEVKAVAREGKRIKIQINCEVKDENDNLIEKKFPQTYVYDPQNNSWFLEP